MNSNNRRGFLDVTRTAGDEAVPPTGASGSMVAYIRDAGRGEVAVMIGGREVTVTDRALLTRLANAIHHGSGAAPA